MQDNIVVPSVAMVLVVVPVAGMQVDFHISADAASGDEKLGIPEIGTSFEVPPSGRRNHQVLSVDLQRFAKKLLRPDDMKQAFEDLYLALSLRLIFFGGFAK